MVSLERLYQQTDDGFEIICHYFPEARESRGNEKRSFRAFRPNEKTPSARLYPPKSGVNQPCWRVADYGDDNEKLSPIDIVRRIEGCNFPEAIMKMAALFGVTDELNREINKPAIKERAATPDDPKEGRVFAFLENIPEHHLPILGPKVKREHAEALGWHAAEYVGYVKDGRVKMEYSTEHYPIFMRECRVPESNGKPAAVFYKIYKPLNPEKQYRFSYTSDGVKPRNYYNRQNEMFALRKTKCEIHNKNEMRLFFSQKHDKSLLLLS